jgi:hypothetical protein
MPKTACQYKIKSELSLEPPEIKQRRLDFKRHETFENFNVILVTTVQTERSFSKLGFIKAKLRNTTGQ